jgi:hypothetical protein
MSELPDSSFQHKNMPPASSVPAVHEKEPATSVIASHGIRSQSCLLMIISLMITSSLMPSASCESDAKKNYTG